MTGQRQWVHTAYPQQVRVGGGQIERLRPLLKDIGTRRVLVLGSARGFASPLGKALLSGLGRGVIPSVFADAAPGVPASAVQTAVRLALTDQIDTVVSFGGGSTVDLGKAVCFFLEQQAGTPGVSFTDRPVATHVAIPTTFSGAEGSAHFSMTDPQTRQVHVTGSPTLVPRYVIADPAGVAGLPAAEVAATGFTSLVHAMEAALAPRRTPESEALANAALSRVYGALLAGPVEDAEARERLQEGAVLSGRAWQHVAPGLSHGLAQLLSGRSAVPYAQAVVALAAPVLRFNADVLGGQLDQVAWAVGSSDLPATLEELRGELLLPTGLSSFGLDDQTIAAVARMSQANPAVQANVRPAAEADVAALLESAAER